VLKKEECTPGKVNTKSMLKQNRKTHIQLVCVNRNGCKMVVPLSYCPLSVVENSDFNSSKHRISKNRSFIQNSGASSKCTGSCNIYFESCSKLATPDKIYKPRILAHILVWKRNGNKKLFFQERRLYYLKILSITPDLCIYRQTHQ
jgi:hypothetical protein